MYSAQVLDHFEHPRNSGELPDASARADLENPVCGDVLEFSIRVEKGRIVAVRFRARGCVASVACASMLTELIAGKDAREALQISHQSLVEALGGLPQGSMHAGHLALDALAECLRQTSS